MSELHPLTTLPEWSDFFRSLISNGRIRVKWSEDGKGWAAWGVEFTSDRTKPLAEEPVGERFTGDDKFDVLEAMLRSHGEEIKQPVWEAFYAFRGAATGHADDIEDLL